MHLTIKAKCTVSEEIAWPSLELLPDSGIFEVMLKIKQDVFYKANHIEIKNTIALL